MDLMCPAVNSKDTVTVADARVSLQGLVDNRYGGWRCIQVNKKAGLDSLGSCQQRPGFAENL